MRRSCRSPCRRRRERACRRFGAGSGGARPYTMTGVGRGAQSCAADRGLAGVSAGIPLTWRFRSVRGQSSVSWSTGSDGVRSAGRGRSARCSRPRRGVRDLWPRLAARRTHLPAAGGLAPPRTHHSRPRAGAGPPRPRGADATHGQTGAAGVHGRVRAARRAGRGRGRALAGGSGAPGPRLRHAAETRWSAERLAAIQRRRRRTASA